MVILHCPLVTQVVDAPKLVLMVRLVAIKTLVFFFLLNDAAFVTVDGND